jgi:hypothetical protein
MVIRKGRRDAGLIICFAYVFAIGFVALLWKAAWVLHEWTAWILMH